MVMKLALAAAALAASTGEAPAASLFFDDFESYTQGAPASIAPTWTIFEGSVDVIGTPGAYPWYPGQQIDMNGSTGESTAAVIFTFVSGFVPGKTYSLSFDYGSNKNSNGDERLLYSLFDNDNFVSNLSGEVATSGPVPNLLSSGKKSFVASGTSLLLTFLDGQFGSPFNDDDDQGGPILDNVRIETAAVPLPAAAPLLLAAVGGLAFAARRRRA